MPDRLKNPTLLPPLFFFTDGIQVTFLCIALSPDLEVFEALSVHFVEEEVRQFLAQLVEAEEETLHVAELQFGLLIC